jgi:hypothetical protein
MTTNIQSTPPDNDNVPRFNFTTWYHGSTEFERFFVHQLYPKNLPCFLQPRVFVHELQRIQQVTRTAVVQETSIGMLAGGICGALVGTVFGIALGAIKNSTRKQCDAPVSIVKTAVTTTLLAALMGIVVNGVYSLVTTTNAMLCHENLVEPWHEGLKKEYLDQFAATHERIRAAYFAQFTSYLGPNAPEHLLALINKAQTLEPLTSEDTALLKQYRTHYATWNLIHLGTKGIAWKGAYKGEHTYSHIIRYLLRADNYIGESIPFIIAGIEDARTYASNNKLAIVLESMHYSSSAVHQLYPQAIADQE